MTHFFLDVLLPIPLEKLFTYKLTETEASFIQPGMRVAVPFGKSKLYTGLALQVHTNAPEVYEAKEIHQILDQKPVVTEIQLAHWQWIASYYMCSMGEVMRSALPNGLLLESETHILRNKNVQIEDDLLKDDEFLIVEALEHQSVLKIDDMIAILEKKTILPVVKRLLEKEVIMVKEEIQEKYKPKRIRHIRLTATYKDEHQLQELLNTLSRAPKQLEAVMAVFQWEAESKKPIKVPDFVKSKKVSSTIIKALIDKNILEEYYVQFDRLGDNGSIKKVQKIQLNQYQQAALETIKSTFSNQKPCLLYGVTASGKTEVYMELMKSYLNAGQQVLYLLPEIALTTQLVNRLKRYFGEMVAVYHSKHNLHERVEIWNAVLEKKAKAQIVIGARSSMFLPFSNLGLVIIDEEHEATFKQFDPAPRYHARDAAMVLGQKFGAHIVLGSATPSVESYKNALDGKYGLAQISKRFGEVLLPDIELVDIRKAHKKKQMKGHFSEMLEAAIQEALDKGEQIILFQNRRGYAPIIECKTCGHSPRCNNCDVSLTYHQYSNQLRCHYCGYHMPLKENCLACGNATLDKKGLGTEQVQEEAKELFPNAKIERMDLDTTRGKYAYDKIIHAFEQKEIDILIGTQMVTKGLDFRNVTLVGIMNADSVLNFPDYRAHERSFQMFTQVAGRAGRTNTRGKVLIQTYNPYHQILQQVSTGDYGKMYEEQHYEREQFKYPPINRMIKITLKDKDYNKLNEAADWFAAVLRQKLSLTILGPEYPPIARIRRSYIKNIMVKMPRTQSPSKTKNSIKRIEKSFNAISKYRSVRLVFNVDHI